MNRWLLAAAALVVPGCGGTIDPDPKGLEPYARYRGALVLAQSGDALDERELLALLKDPHPLARDGAVVALGIVGKREHVPALIDMAFETVEEDGACPAHPEIRRMTPAKCPKCGAALVPDTLSRKEVRNTPLVRADACRALAKIRDPRAIRPLIGVLRGDFSVDVQRAAVLSLEAFADQTEALEAVIDAVGSANAPVAYNAHRVLSRVARRDDIPPQRDEWLKWLKSRAP
jgi:HEAT repeat protein